VTEWFTEPIRDWSMKIPSHLPYHNR
jgi:hypothetical protein